MQETEKTIDKKVIDYINNISKPKSQKIRSKLNRFIPDDVKDQLYLIASDVTIPDDNEKADMISRIMENIGFQEIGTGTNRIAFMKDEPMEPAPPITRMVFPFILFSISLLCLLISGRNALCNL